MGKNTDVILDELLRLIETASGGSRELDSLLAVHHYAAMRAVVVQVADRYIIEFDQDEHDSMRCPHYTTSIDAKLSWEDELCWTVISPNDFDNDRWTALTRWPDGDITYFGHGHTEPLARRAAALRIHGETITVH